MLILFKEGGGDGTNLVADRTHARLDVEKFVSANPKLKKEHRASMGRFGSASVEMNTEAQPAFPLSFDGTSGESFAWPNISSKKRTGVISTL